MIVAPALCICHRSGGPPTEDKVFGENTPTHPDAKDEMVSSQDPRSSAEDNRISTQDKRSAAHDNRSSTQEHRNLLPDLIKSRLNQKDPSNKNSSSPKDQKSSTQDQTTSTGIQRSSGQQERSSSEPRRSRFRSAREQQQSVKRLSRSRTREDVVQGMTKSNTVHLPAGQIPQRAITRNAPKECSTKSDKASNMMGEICVTDTVYKSNQYVLPTEISSMTSSTCSVDIDQDIETADLEPEEPTNMLAKIIVTIQIQKTEL